MITPCVEALLKQIKFWMTTTLRLKRPDLLKVIQGIVVGMLRLEKKKKKNYELGGPLPCP